MKKNKAPLIPLTKLAAPPAGAPALTIGQLQTEAISRLRRINSDQNRVGEIIDILVAEVMEREGRLLAAAAAQVPG